MAPLKAAGLVRAMRGMKGGYQLTKPAGEVTLSDIYTAIEGPVLLVGCLEQDTSCQRAATCPTRDIWLEMNESLRSTLQRTTLADLVEKDARMKAASTETYTI